MKEQNNKNKNHYEGTKQPRNMSQKNGSLLHDDCVEEKITGNQNHEIVA